jgi:O-antigen/teichoic acid export membrane protein
MGSKLRIMWNRIRSLLFENRTLGQTVAKNTFWLGVSNIGGRLLRALIIVYAARVLGVAEYGVFSYAVTLAAFLTIFIDFGLNHILVREFTKAQDEIRRKEVISTLFFLKIVLIGTGVIVILALAPYFTKVEAAKAILPIVAMILAFDSLREFGFSLSRANEKMEWEAGLFLFTNLAIVALGFTFLMLSPSVISFTYSYAFGTGAGAILTFVVLRKYFQGVFSHFSSALIKPIFLAAWPFAISGLLGGLMLNTDILILGWFRPVEEVGLYSAAQRIIQVLYVIPSVIATGALPSFSRFAHSDPAKMRRVFERVLSLSLMLAMPIALGGVLVGPRLIGFMFGDAYLPAGLSFQILILTLLIDFSAVILANATFAHDRQKNLIIYSALGALGNVILDLILIPYWGGAGSAIATFAAQGISNIYLWIMLRRIMPFGVLGNLKRAGVALVLMLFVVGLASYLGLHVLIVIALGGISYFGTLYLLREPIAEELRLIISERA